MIPRAKLGGQINSVREELGQVRTTGQVNPAAPVRDAELRSFTLNSTSSCGEKRAARKSGVLIAAWSLFEGRLSCADSSVFAEERTNRYNKCDNHETKGSEISQTG
jgi:hypothetical protein